MPPWVLRELLFRSYSIWLALIVRSPWRRTTCPFRVSIPFSPTMLSLLMLILPPPASDFSVAAGRRPWAAAAAVVGPAGALADGALAAARGGCSARTTGARPPNDSRAVQNGLQRGMWDGIIM